MTATGMLSAAAMVSLRPGRGGSPAEVPDRSHANDEANAIDASSAHRPGGGWELVGGGGWGAARSSAKRCGGGGGGMGAEPPSRGVTDGSRPRKRRRFG